MRLAGSAILLAGLLLLMAPAQACTPAREWVAGPYRETAPADFTRFQVAADRIDTNLAGWNATYYLANGTWAIGGPYFIDRPEQYRTDARGCEEWDRQFRPPSSPVEPSRNPLFAFQQHGWAVALQYQDAGAIRRVVGVNVTWAGGQWHADVAQQGPASDVALVPVPHGYILLDPARDRALALPTEQGAPPPHEIPLALPGTDGARTIRRLGSWPVILHPQERPATVNLAGNVHTFPFPSWDEEVHSAQEAVVGVNGTWHWLEMDDGWTVLRSAPDPGATLDNWAQNLYEGGWFIVGERTFVWRRGEPAPEEVPWAGRVAYAHHGELGIWTKGGNPSAIYRLDPLNLTVDVIARPAEPTGAHPAVAGTGYQQPLNAWPPAPWSTPSATTSTGPATSTKAAPLPALVLAIVALAASVSRRR
jgi:hypothetical protein